MERGSGDVQGSRDMEYMYMQLPHPESYTSYSFNLPTSGQHDSMRITNFLPCLFSLLGLTVAIPRPQSTGNVKRQASQLLDSYDFVIAGGGTSGLTIADRLTEAFPESLSKSTVFPCSGERVFD